MSALYGVIFISAGFGLFHGLNLDRQAEQVDKAGGIRLIINLVLVEGGDLLVIQG